MEEFEGAHAPWGHSTPDASRPQTMTRSVSAGMPTRSVGTIISWRKGDEPAYSSGSSINLRSRNSTATRSAGLSLASVSSDICAARGTVSCTN